MPSSRALFLHGRPVRLTCPEALDACAAAYKGLAPVGKAPGHILVSLFEVLRLESEEHR
jgi:hypothetical protein